VLRLLHAVTRPRLGRIVAGVVLVSIGYLGLLAWFSVSLATKAVRSQAEAGSRTTATSSAPRVGQLLNGLVGSYAQRRLLIAPMHPRRAGCARQAIGSHLTRWRLIDLAVAR
jgi:hypothetical protein